MDRCSNRSSSLKIVDGLPIVSATLSYNNKSISTRKVLVDTGSGGTIFSADKLLEIGVALSSNDELIRISGVGGTELAFSKILSEVKIGDLKASNFSIEVGAMDYIVSISMELSAWIFCLKLEL